MSMDTTSWPGVHISTGHGPLEHWDHNDRFERIAMIDVQEGDPAMWDAVKQVAPEDDFDISTDEVISFMIDFGFGPDDHGIQSLLQIGYMLAMKHHRDGTLTSPD